MTTLCYFCIQICRSAHQSRHLSPFYIVKGSRSNDRRADRPCFCKRRHTVRAETGCAAHIPISWLMVHDVVIRFCWSELTIYLSSPVLVMGRRWNPAYRSVWPSVTQWFHICMIVDRSRFVREWYRGTIIHVLDRQWFCLIESVDLPLSKSDTCW